MKRAFRGLNLGKRGTPPPRMWSPPSNSPRNMAGPDAVTGSAVTRPGITTATRNHAGVLSARGLTGAPMSAGSSGSTSGPADEYVEGCDYYSHGVFNSAGAFCPCVPDQAVAEWYRRIDEWVRGGFPVGNSSKAPEKSGMVLSGLMKTEEPLTEGVKP